MEFGSNGIYSITLNFISQVIEIASLVLKSITCRCRLPRNFHVWGSFGEVGVMEFGLKGTSRVCRGRHGEVGMMEFGLKTM